MFIKLNNIQSDKSHGIEQEIVKVLTVASSYSMSILDVKYDLIFSLLKRYESKTRID